MHQVFVSYSHQDAPWLALLRIHLKPLVREGLDLWDDSRIQAGQSWRVEIERALSAARVAVLLISPNFLASDFVHNHELPKLLESAATGGTIILCLIIKPSLFEEFTELSRFQAINPPNEPLITLTEAEQAAYYVRLARRIKEILAHERLPACDPAQNAAHVEQAVLGTNRIEIDASNSPSERNAPAISGFDKCEDELLEIDRVFAESTPQKRYHPAMIFAEKADFDFKPPIGGSHYASFSRKMTFMSATPVTQFDYYQVTGNKPSLFPSIPDAPVTNITLLDAVKYCNRLSEILGYKPCYEIIAEKTGFFKRPMILIWKKDRSHNGFRIPTETEWQAGTNWQNKLGLDALIRNNPRNKNLDDALRNGTIASVRVKLQELIKLAQDAKDDFEQQRMDYDAKKNEFIKKEIGQKMNLSMTELSIRNDEYDQFKVNFLRVKSRYAIAMQKWNSYRKEIERIFQREIKFVPKVATAAPNAKGFYDMIGFIDEWVWLTKESEQNASSSSLFWNETGIVRGGNMLSLGFGPHMNTETKQPFHQPSSFTGFRIVRIEYQGKSYLEGHLDRAF